MSRRNLRGRNTTKTNQRRRARLTVEQLEDRCLLDAGLASALYDSGQILVGYQTGSKIEVRSVELSGNQSVQDAVSAYSSQAGVAFAEPDYQVRTAVIPNDPSFGSLYGLNNTGQSGGTVDADIDAPEAWDLDRKSTRLNSSHLGISYAVFCF